MGLSDNLAVSTRIGHPELLVTTFFLHVPFSLLFFFLSSISFVDCYLCFSEPSFVARRDDGTLFLPSPSSSGHLARFFFCPIAMYIFSVQSRPALMLPKALFSLSPFLYPASIERESHLKSALLSLGIYIYIGYVPLSTCANDRT